MRRVGIIGLILVSLLAWAGRAPRKAYLVDDAYYWPIVDSMSNTPVYSKNIREFVFIEDTVGYADTIRMKIIEGR
jgi:hypothetical protein